MKGLKCNIFLFTFVLFSACFGFSQQAFADYALPYLDILDGGNYEYNSITRELTFSNLNADMAEYTNGEYGMSSVDDPILGNPLSFGTLTNSSSEPLVFSPATLTVAGFFTAELSNFIVDDTSQLMNGKLSNIQRLDDGASRYLDELLEVGGGSGILYMFFTPTITLDESGIEHFTADSDGSVAGFIAAPIPPSAALLLSGLGGTFVFGNFRRKRIS